MESPNETSLKESASMNSDTIIRNKYLGSFIAYNLRDCYTIDMRIAAASKSMGMLKGFFNKKQISTYTKFLIFRAITLNILLWGCENWAMRADLLSKLERFVNRQVRKLLHITMTQVKEEHITIKQLRERFHNLRSIQSMIDERKMKLLGKIICDDVTTIPRQLLIAFVPNVTRRLGRPINCCRLSMRESLIRLTANVQEINIDHYGSLKSWYYDARDKNFWWKLIEHLKDPTKPVPVPNPSHRDRRNPRRSGRAGSNNTSNQESENADTPPPPPSPRPRPRPNQGREESPPPTPRSGRAFDPEGVGRNMYDSLNILGLGYGASYAEVNAQYYKLALVYHPDKYHTGLNMSEEDAAKHFRLVKDARNYLKEVLVRD